MSPVDSPRAAAGASPPEPPPDTFGAGEALADVPVAAEDAAALNEVRLTPAVAAALRAAVDWLIGERGLARPLRGRADDAALELVFERVDGRGLRAAGEVLALVGGCLSRVETARPDAPWVVRVPVFSGREHFLMVVESGLPIALPWPAVIHVCMARPEEIDSPGRPPVVSIGAGERREMPASGAGGAAEVPAILIGHGLRRAYCIADRLVWRLPALTVEVDTPPPAPGLTRAVETDEGERFWVADPAWLLYAVEPPVLESPPPGALPPLPPPEARDDGAIRVAALILSEDDVQPLEAPPHPPAFAPAPEPPRPAPPAPEAHAPAAAPVAPPDPSPQPGAPAPESPRPLSPPAVAPAPAAPPPSPAPSPARRFRTALVAEDSITASIFLARLLEQQGFLVRVVRTAGELSSELARGEWSLVCADVELPDARGPEYLRALREALERAHPRGAGNPAMLVALVRDAEDAAAAEAAGISRVLRKPFDQGSLEQLLRRAGLLAAEGA